MKALFIIEEHNEAFLIWHYAKKNGLIHETNSLLHFDYHPDMSLPNLRTSITELGTSIEDIKNFTYNEIGIGNFIYPAIYQRLINKVYWFSMEKPDSTLIKNDLYVRTYKNEGKIFISGSNSSSFKDFNHEQDEVQFEMYYTTVADEFLDTQNIILDIDLDYFSCELFNKKSNRIEIPREEYYKYKSDKYHFLKLTGNYFVEEINNRYYLFPNSSLGFQLDIKEHLSHDEILQRIDRFIEFLVRYNIQPAIIDICRSSLSGFTPEHHCNFIQDNLIGKLSRIYLFDSIFINELFP